MQAADAAAERAGEARQVLGLEVDPRCLHGLVRSDDRILDEGREPARLLLGKSRLDRVVAGDAPGDGDTVFLGHIARKRGDGGFARHHAIPKGIDA